MTEEEAKKKICPMSMNGDQYMRCIASRCMAWRWEQTAIEYEDPTRGFCGLAGKDIPS